uniref:Nuclear speckle splicing regulatory protein 1 n=1 Tax=Hippocampus comes TaxID=109280 RepID=A0A3Q2YU63_HIPCM
MGRICRKRQIRRDNMAVPAKQYGLILPQKKCLTKPTRPQKLSVFGDDSDDEASVGESLQKEAAKKKTMRQTQLEMKKALEEDSTVYDYDAVYDEIQRQRLDNSKKVLSGADKKPKYIHQLMKAVNSRKKEQERREERKIQKEREAEGDQFADKEAYVTSAYKRKLQEQKDEEERERRQAAIEAALDVRKQKDLSGFYRHLLNQTVGEEAIPERLANKYVCLCLQQHTVAFRYIHTHTHTHSFTFFCAGSCAEVRSQTTGSFQTQPKRETSPQVPEATERKLARSSLVSARRPPLRIPNAITDAGQHRREATASGTRAGSESRRTSGGTETARVKEADAETDRGKKTARGSRAKTRWERKRSRGRRKAKRRRPKSASLPNVPTSRP